MHIINFSFECGGFDHRLMRGGLSPLVWNLSKEYAARGHRVSIVTPAHGHLDGLRRRHRVERLDYRHDHVMPLVLDPRVWPGHPPEIEVPLTTRAYRLRPAGADGVDVYLLSNDYLDLLPDRLYPPPGTEGRDLSYFKPLVFQVDGLRFIEGFFGREPAVVHGFEPYYHYLLPPVLRRDPLRVTVGTVAANAPIAQKVYRPQVERLLKLFAADDTDLDAPDAPPPPGDGPAATVSRVLAGTRMHQEYGPDYVSFFPLIAAHADLVDFVSPGQRDWYTTFRDSPVEALFDSLPASAVVRENAHKMFAGGCGVSDTWLARDPASVDRDRVLTSLGLVPGRPTFYHASRYAVHHKGQLELMRAVEEVLATDPGINFVIRCATGGGGAGTPLTPPDAYFQRVADRYPHNVSLHWRLADEDTLFDHAASADFCVFPSKYELDGFLIAQAEAMACGAVPIATDQQVTSHFGHGTGFATAPGEPTGFAVRRSFRDDDPRLAAELADRIRQAAALWREEPDAYRRLADRARHTARRFTWARSAQARLAAFEGLLSGRTPRVPVEVALRNGWFERLDAAERTAHRAALADAAADRGDLDAYAACAPLDQTAYRRLFTAACRRGDFPRALAIADRAGRADWAEPVRGRCRLWPDGDGGSGLTYVFEHAEAVEMVVETPPPSVAGQPSVATPPPSAGPPSPETGPETGAEAGAEASPEAYAPDEAAPAGPAGGPRLVPLTGSGGVFHRALPDRPAGGHLTLMVTLRSGRTVWDAIPLPPPPVAPRKPAARTRFTVVATDLDGTLLHRDLTVSPRTRAALAGLTAAGARHLIVTGRPAAAGRRLLTSLGYQGIAVCGQGGQLYDAGRDRLLSSVTLDRDLARSVVARVEAALDAGPLTPAVVTAAPASRLVAGRGFADRPHRGWQVVDDPERLWAGPIEKVLLRHPVVSDARIAATAARVAGGEVSVAHSEPGMVEILPPGTDKGQGLRRAAELLGFDLARTVAFGDMPNDIPMFRQAGYGVAMGNAHPDLVRIADEVTAGNDADGVARVLERWFPPPPLGSAGDHHLGTPAGAATGGPR